MITDILKSIEFFKTTKKLDITKLPSKAFFYNTDFYIKIKKVELEDIIYYKHNYIADNAIVVIELIKHIVRKNTFYPKGYSFDDVRSIDVVYIFFKLIEWTNKSSLSLKNINPMTGFVDKIPVLDSNFNYFVPLNKYKLVDGEFVTPSGFKFRIPSIKVEDSLTKFITLKFYMGKNEYMDANYDFIYFLGKKNNISDDDIESLLDIFSNMEKSDKEEVHNIVEDFRQFAKYSITYDGLEYSLDGRLDLENAFDI